MHFTVRHVTHYRYSAPVRLAPHVLRLTPRAENARDLAHMLVIDPAPARRQDLTDAFGNPLTRVAFEGSCTEFRIESRFTLETLMPPAIEGSALPALPWPVATDAALAPFAADPAPEPAVTDFAAALADASGGAPRAFLEQLTGTLYARIDRHIRPDGAARTAAETLALASGACRDITTLFMAACRAQGIPVRFASGYQARAETPDGKRHLHAWPEVFLPGHGWTGFDPTHGMPVTDGHVALAAAPDQAATMPIEGGFFGAGITSTLDYSVEVAASD